MHDSLPKSKDGDSRREIDREDKGSEKPLAFIIRHSTMSRAVLGRKRLASSANLPSPMVSSPTSLTPTSSPFMGGRASLLPTRTGMISYPLAGISRPLTKVSAKLTSIGRGKLLPLASKPMLASARLYMLATVKPASM